MSINRRVNTAPGPVLCKDGHGTRKDKRDSLRSWTQALCNALPLVGLRRQSGFVDSCDLTSPRSQSRSLLAFFVLTHTLKPVPLYILSGFRSATRRNFKHLQALQGSTLRLPRSVRPQKITRPAAPTRSQRRWLAGAAPQPRASPPRWLRSPRSAGS